MLQRLVEKYNSPPWCNKGGTQWSTSIEGIVESRRQVGGDCKKTTTPWQSRGGPCWPEKHLPSTKGNNKDSLKGASRPTEPSMHSEDNKNKEQNLKGEVAELFASTLWGIGNYIRQIQIKVTKTKNLREKEIPVLLRRQPRHEQQRWNGRGLTHSRRGKLSTEMERANWPIWV